MPHISEVKYPKVLSYLNELQSWEWTYGNTPKFSIALANLNLTLTVEKGRIQHVSEDSWKGLEGDKFGLKMFNKLISNDQ